MYETMQSLGSSSATTAFAAVLLLGVAVDVLLVLAVPAFLVKRSVFNRCLGNEPASSRRKALHENATATLGAYEVEAAFFRDIGVRPPWELPLDLLALGLILAVVVGLALTAPNARGLNVTIAVAGAVAVSFVRFWRERRGIWSPRGVTPETPALLHSGA